MKCINCGKEMKQEDYEGVIIDRCKACDSVWLDYGELSYIIKKREKKFTIEEKTIQINKKGIDESVRKSHECPKCGKKMERFNYAVNSGVILDRCPDMHGLWFDNGEFDRIQIVMEEADQIYSDSGLDATETPDVKMCPRCDKPLHENQYENISLDQCGSCGGYWCDDDELAQVLFVRHKKFTSKDFPEIKAGKDKSRISKPDTLISELRCVLCGSLMERTNFQYSSGIIVDRCKNGHGVWLDKDGLEKIQIFSERWEVANDKLSMEYKAILSKIKRDAEERYGKAVNASRFNLINRMVRSLARLVMI